jgi:sodium transport system permease protein
VQVQILYDATNFESLDGALRVETSLNETAKTLLEGRLAAAGIDNAYITPLDVEQVNVAPPSKTTGNLLGQVLPLLMVVMIALGAFYPAVDLTAGEKERGTFETLLSTPASKLDIVLGKFLAVCFLAILTGLLNLGSMGLTFAAMLAQVKPMFEQDLALEFSLPAASVGWIIFLIFPFGALISALMMSIAVYAKSFKDAQNYVTPFFLVLMAPAMLAALPGTTLTFANATVPVLNVVLLFRSLMTDAASIPLALTVLGATIVHALLALAFAAWIFHREDVVLADKSAPLFGPRRKPQGLRSSANFGEAMSLFILAFVLLIFVGPYVQAAHPLGGIALVQFTIILLPALVFLWALRIDPVEALSLRNTRTRAWLGAIALGAGFIVLNIQIAHWANQLFPTPRGMAEYFTELLGGERTPTELALLIAVVAITPAICEEILFRGVLLSALRSQLGKTPSIIIVAILFGCFHLSIFRAIPTAAFGAVLAYVCLRSASILPSILLHACNNAFAILLVTGVLMPEAQLIALQSTGLPWPVLTSATGLALIGLALIESNARRLPFQTQSPPD